MRRQLCVHDLQRKAGLSLRVPQTLQENDDVHREIPPDYGRVDGNVALIEDSHLVKADLAFQEGTILDAGAESGGVDRGLVSS